ncbi:MAG: hypothetical protein HYS15_00470 [Candidatus Spechtbacteria bacterium]|nr:hypothetical protein [Candidatus Spechtbacteria bacterium]
MNKKNTQFFVFLMCVSLVFVWHQKIAGAYGAVNHAPTLDFIADKTIDEGQELLFSVFASDPDGDAITYSSPARPMGATLSKVTVSGKTYALFKWTPSYEQSGVYSVAFLADDGKGGSDSRLITVSVKDVAVIKDVVAPTIQNISLTNTTENSATIAWSTDERAYGRIEYGVSGSYGNTTSLTSTTTKAFIQTAGNLKPGTLYHYRNWEKDDSGNETFSGDNTFSTTALEVVLEGKKRGEIREGSLIRNVGEGSVFAIKNGKKTHVANPEVFKERGYKWENVVEVSGNIFEDYRETRPLVRAKNTSAVYEIIHGKKRLIATQEVFSSLGLDWNDVAEVAPAELSLYRDAKLLRASDDARVYFITDKGLRKWIRNLEIFNSYVNSWNDVVVVSKKDLDIYPDVELIRLEGSDKVYKLEDTTKRWIKNAVAFHRIGYDWNSVVSVNKTEFEFYKDGTLIE